MTTATAAGTEFETVEAALTRTLRSRIFRRSARHRRFLEYIVRAAIAGAVDQTKELIVGIEVFGRSASLFDPRTDPIVRVEAGRLRDRLARYYLDEGQDDELRIDLPVGTYLPLFTPRHQRPADVAKARSAIAIVPFDNLSGQASDQTFCVGMADQLIDALSRFPGRRVVARHSTLKAKADGMDLGRMKKMLGVAYVVSGSLQRGGDRVRCIVRLERTRDRAVLWSDRFEYDPALARDPFEFQDRMAAATLDAVLRIDRSASTGASNRDQAEPVLPRSSSHLEARELFERARYLGRSRTVEGCAQAVDLLERAVALDSRYAQAYTELGVATFNLAALTLAPTFPSLMRAQRAAWHARELDPTDGEALSLLAAIAFRIERNWSAAEPMFLEALRLTPQSAATALGFANCLIYVGRFDDGLAQARRALQLDPLNLGLRSSIAALTSFAGQHDEAVRQFLEVLEQSPDHFFSLVMMGVAHLSGGNPVAAGRAMQQACAIAPDHATPRFGRVGSMALAGDIAGAREELAAVLTSLQGKHYSRYNLALAQAALGDADAMFRSLDHAADAHDILFVTLPVHALFRPFHDDPRFPALLERTNLRAV